MSPRAKKLAIKLVDAEIGAAELTVFSHSEFVLGCAIHTISDLLQGLGFRIAVDCAFTKVKPIRCGSEDRVCRISLLPPELPQPVGKRARSAKRR